MRPTSINPTILGQKLLYEAMQAKGLTQKALAEHLGIGAVRLNHLLQGRSDRNRSTEPTLREAFDMFRFLGVPPGSWLVELERAATPRAMPTWSRGWAELPNG